MKQNNFFTRNKGVLINLLESLIIKLLKLQISGGIRGWILNTLVSGFAKEIVEIFETGQDYKISKKVYNDTAEDEDRDRATDTLNNSW